jgi:hypothetical protein
MAIIAQTQEDQIQAGRRSDAKVHDLLAIGSCTQRRRGKVRWNWVKIDRSRKRTGQQTGLKQAQIAGRIVRSDPTLIAQPHIDSLPGEMFLTK